jgi:broad specificity phosphatase PhoE
MTTQIVFETHSVSTDNESGIATGWLDGQLSEEGRRLARRLGVRRRGERIDGGTQPFPGGESYR